MNVVTTAQGKTFNVEHQQSILDAAALQGIHLPYSCRTGRCSTCKCKIVAGDSCAIRDEQGLSEQEKKTVGF